jgi:hypothetical protein
MYYIRKNGDPVEFPPLPDFLNDHWPPKRRGAGVTLGVFYALTLRGILTVTCCDVPRIRTSMGKSEGHSLKGAMKWARGAQKSNQIHQINPNQPQISHLIVNHGDLVPSDDSGETFLGPWPLHPRCPGQIVVTETPSSWRRWGQWFLFFTR